MPLQLAAASPIGRKSINFWCVARARPKTAKQKQARTICFILTMSSGSPRDSFSPTDAGDAGGTVNAIDHGALGYFVAGPRGSAATCRYFRPARQSGRRNAFCGCIHHAGRGGACAGVAATQFNQAADGRSLVCRGASLSGNGTRPKPSPIRVMSSSHDSVIATIFNIRPRS